jgi:two-component system, sensor histidine kinase PdtaS
MNWIYIFLTQTLTVSWVGLFAQNYGEKDTNLQNVKLAQKYQSQAEWFLKIPHFNYDSASFYFDESIAIFKKSSPINYEKLTEIYLDIAINMDKSYGYSKFETAISKANEYFNKIPNKNKKHNLLQYHILIQEAKNLNTHGGSTSNLDLMVKAASLIKNDTRPEVQADLVRDKAKIYLFFNSNKVNFAYPYLKESEKYFEKAKTESDIEELYTVYMDLSWYYNVLQKHDSSQYYFDKQKALLPQIKNPILIEYYYTNKANNFIRQKKYEQALPLLTKCHNVAIKYKLQLSRFYLFNQRLFGIIADKNNDYLGAINYFQESLKGSIAIGNVGYETDCYYFLMDIYPKIGDYKKAWEYQKKYADLAIFEAEKTNEKSMRESELQFSVLQKDQEILKKHNERNLYLSGLLIGLLIIGLLYRNYNIKQKSNSKLESLNLNLETKNTQLDKKNAENELLLKEIHHRVKNNLEVVSSLLALQSAKMDDPDMQAAMLASQNRVQSMGILHQKLYQSEHLAFIEMKNYFQNLSENILDSYNETDRIKVEIEMKEVDLDIDTAVPLGLIVNELLTNSLKYAFPVGTKGIIKLSLESLENGDFNLKVSDNGIGKILNAKAKGTGFGTQLVDLLTRQIDGKLVQEVSNGTMISINFKRQMAA